MSNVTSLTPFDSVDSPFSSNFCTAHNVYKEHWALSNRDAFLRQRAETFQQGARLLVFLVLPDVLGPLSSVEVVRRRPSSGSPSYPLSTTTTIIVLDSWSLFSPLVWEQINKRSVRLDGLGHPYTRPYGLHLALPFVKLSFRVPSGFMDPVRQ